MGSPGRAALPAPGLLRSQLLQRMGLRVLPCNFCSADTEKESVLLRRAQQ